MRRISTHVLDTARGGPASGVAVRLERQEVSGAWTQLTAEKTDEDGRCGQLLPADLTGQNDLPAGRYRLSFDTASYYSSCSVAGLYPVVEITFEARGGESHFHIPLLLSPNGYTTYRGS